MNISRKIAVLALIVVIIAVPVGWGYSVQYSGTVVSEYNVNKVGVYALHIYQGDEEILAPLQLSSVPTFTEGTDANGHKCIIITDNIVNTLEYTMVTDATDDVKGAHIRMWVFFGNSISWPFIDSIQLNIVDKYGTESFTCGIDESGTTGICTQMIELEPLKLKHDFSVTITYKTEVSMDYKTFGEIAVDPKISVVFVYDDEDPVVPPEPEDPEEPI